MIGWVGKRPLFALSKLQCHGLFLPKFFCGLHKRFKFVGFVSFVSKILNDRLNFVYNNGATTASKSSAEIIPT